MFKHTITRVRPSTDVKWPSEVEGGVSVDTVFLLTSTATLSGDGLTKQTIREVKSRAVIESIEGHLSNSESGLFYWITSYCNDNGITTTFMTEES